MRGYISITFLVLFISSSLIRYTTAGEETLVYETSLITFTIPNGWSANEIEAEAYLDIKSFDGELIQPPLGLVSDDAAVGLMILTSSRDDNANTLFDYMLLRQWSKFEIYRLHEGEYTFESHTGKEMICSLTINAIDDGQSAVLISHNIILYVGEKRYEFAYIADAEDYAANFDDVEMMLSSIEFL